MSLFKSPGLSGTLLLGAAVWLFYEYRKSLPENASYLGPSSPRSTAPVPAVKVSGPYRVTWASNKNVLTTPDFQAAQLAALKLALANPGYPVLVVDVATGKQVGGATSPATT